MDTTHTFEIASSEPCSLSRFGSSTPTSVFSHTPLLWQEFNRGLACATTGMSVLDKYLGSVQKTYTEQGALLVRNVERGPTEALASILQSTQVFILASLEPLKITPNCNHWHLRPLMGTSWHSSQNCKNLYRHLGKTDEPEEEQEFLGIRRFRSRKRNWEQLATSVSPSPRPHGSEQRTGRHL